MLIGSGGREHALAWKLAQSPSCDTLFAAPGNPGIAEEAELVDLDIADHAAVIAFCAGHDIGLVVVGPEAPLVDGLGDSLRDAGIPVFGPNQNAAQLEGSKGFTKDMCAAANIPTAGYRRHDSKASALAGLEAFQPPYVIKADGLAAGKGVIIAENLADAQAAIEDMFGGGFGDAGAAVVLEEFMLGEEASFFALTDGHDVVAFGSAQDHKRVGDGDTGPNTGGMGAYSPAPVLTQALQDEVMERIIRPTVGYMSAQGMPYSGVLFAGLMLTEEGPKLIEYNARFGDPECQVLDEPFSGRSGGSYARRCQRKFVSGEFAQLLARHRFNGRHGGSRLSWHAAKGRRNLHRLRDTGEGISSRYSRKRRPVGCQWRPGAQRDRHGRQCDRSTAQRLCGDRGD